MSELVRLRAELEALRDESGLARFSDCSPALSQMGSDGGDWSIGDLANFADFAGEQAASWEVRWMFSALDSPDTEAKGEAGLWHNFWMILDKSLCDAAPEMGDLNSEVHRLRILKTSLLAAEVHYSKSRARELAAALVSRFAIILGGCGLTFLAVPMYRWALYPNGTIGRAGIEPDWKT